MTDVLSAHMNKCLRARSAQLLIFITLMCVRSMKTPVCVMNRWRAWFLLYVHNLQPLHSLASPHARNALTANSCKQEANQLFCEQKNNAHTNIQTHTMSKRKRECQQVCACLYCANIIFLNSISKAYKQRARARLLRPCPRPRRAFAFGARQKRRIAQQRKYLHELTRLTLWRWLAGWLAKLEIGVR